MYVSTFKYPDLFGILAKSDFSAAFLEVGNTSGNTACVLYSSTIWPLAGSMVPVPDASAAYSAIAEYTDTALFVLGQVSGNLADTTSPLTYADLEFSMEDSPGILYPWSEATTEVW